jgi:DNA-binding NarL/FixJ family response regulator
MASESAAFETRQLTAVICDDDKLTRQIVRRILERTGYKVLAGVGTALEALDLVLSHRVDVLMLDLVLPGVPGEDIIASVKECSRDTHVIVHSSFNPLKAVKSGARHFVSKGQLGRLEETLIRVSGREVSRTA